MERKEVLLQELAVYEHRFPNEEALILAMRNFVLSHEDAFSRECRDGHITGSALIVNYDFSKVLLLYHKKLRLWVQPGGHCDPGEQVYETSCREIIEETGIEGNPLAGKGIFDIAKLYVPAWNDVAEHWHYDIRNLFFSEEGRETISHESQDIGWFSLEEAVRKNPDPDIAKAVNKIKCIRNSNMRLD